MSDSNDVVRREALERTVSARLLSCSLDELRVMDFVLGRLEVGRDRYGLLDLGDPRRRSLNYKRERAEEVADAIVYTAFDAIIEHDKRVEAIVAQADETLMGIDRMPAPKTDSAWGAAVERARTKLADRILHEPANQSLAERIHRRAVESELPSAAEWTKLVERETADWKAAEAAKQHALDTHGWGGKPVALELIAAREAGDRAYLIKQPLRLDKHGMPVSATGVVAIDLSDCDDSLPHVVSDDDLPRAIAADLTRGSGRVPSPEVVAFGHAMASADDEVAPTVAVAEEGKP